MKHPTRGFLIAALFVLFRLPLGAQAIVHQITLPSGMNWCDDGMINGLFSDINSLRTQNGVAALSMSTLGMKDAEMRAVQFAQYMATANPSDPNFNPHQGWDTTAASLGYDVISEDLAFANSDPAWIVGVGWQDRLHLAALLTTEANVAGVSCVYANASIYWTYEPGACTGTGCGNSPAPAPTPTLDSEDWAFLTLINNYRAQNGLGSLQADVILQNAAQWMSNDMAANNYFSHTDSLGRSTGARLLAFGYTYAPWGENLAAGYSDAQDAFNGWVNACDPDGAGNCTYAHRANMLGAGYTAIGIARAYGASSAYGWYWTTDFGGVVDQAIQPGSGSGSGPAPGGTPTITSFTAAPSSITAGQSATLTWNISGADSAIIDNGIGVVSPTSGSVTVTPQQTTTYTLIAANAVYGISAKTTVTVSPGSKDTTPPTAPVLTAATAKSSTEVDLAWTASTDNVGVAGYQVLRNGAAVQSVGASTLAFADTGLTAGTTYTYTVKAFDAAGNYSAASNSLQATTPAGTPPPPAGQPCPNPATNAFTGCYYSNLTLSGNPVLARTDSQINFAWGFAGPGSGLPTSGYSVRWQGNFTLSAGTYTFTAVTSDGMRVYIDGSMILNRWYDQAIYEYIVSSTLSQGTHLITVEYYDDTGYSMAQLTWQNSTPATQPPSVLSFTANPAAVTAGQTATLNWSVNGATSITIDNGVGDVTGKSSVSVQPAQTTTYTLTATNSAGSSPAKVTVTVTAATDKQPPTAPVLTSAVAKSATEVDLAWSASTDNVGVTGYLVLRNGANLASLSGTTLTYADLSAAANATYTYSVEAFDAAGNYSIASNAIQVTTPAAAPSGGSCPPAATGAFTACYYNGTSLSGNPVLTETDSQINFDWGAGSPGSAVTPSNFSARFQGYFNFNNAVYSFGTLASDGIRVYIDGQLLIDHWQDESVSSYQARSWMTQGSHLITVEYYEHTGAASCHVTWQGR